MPATETAYLFRHALLRDAAYQLQLPRDRGRLHGLAAASIEALNLGPGKVRRLDAAAAEIAGHLRVARVGQDSPDLLNRERRFTWRAALHLESREQHGRALPLWLRWLEICEAEKHPKALLRAGISAAYLDKTDLAATLLRRAREEGQSAGDRLHLGKVALELGSFWWSLGRMEEARVELASARSLLEEAGDRAGLASALGTLAIVCEQTGDMPEAEHHYARALEIQRELGSRRGQGRTLSNLGGLYGQTDRVELAERTYARALGIHRETGDRRFEGVTLGNLASLLQSVGRFGEAESACTQALSIHREVGNRRGEGSTLKNLAHMRLLAGRPEEAEIELERALSVLSECQNRRGEGLARAAIANVYRLTDRPVLAVQTFDIALAILRDVNYPRGVGVLLGDYGQCLMAMGQKERAWERWQEGAAILEGLGDRLSLDQFKEGVRAACSKAGVPADGIQELGSSAARSI